MQGKRLAHILLMHAKPFATVLDAVIALDHDRNFVAKPTNAEIRHDQARGSRQSQAKMLVLRMAVPLAGRRFQDMSCGLAAGRDAPAVPLQEKSRFRLGARKTELARIHRGAPGGMIGSQRAQAFGNSPQIE